MAIPKKLIGKYVIIRTSRAGVHYGVLNDVESTSNEDYDVELINCRRIYLWTGAFTLSELATQPNTKEGKKFSVTIPSIYLKAIEIIEMTDVAVKDLNNVPNFKI